jgi:hypothetical protein
MQSPPPKLAFWRKSTWWSTLVGTLSGLASMAGGLAAIGEFDPHAKAISMAVAVIASGLAGIAASVGSSLAQRTTDVAVEHVTTQVAQVADTAAAAAPTEPLFSGDRRAQAAPQQTVTEALRDVPGAVTGGCVEIK